MANRAQVTVRMSADLRAKLEMHAAAAKTTPAGFARELIRRGLKHDPEGSMEPGHLTLDQIERLFAAAITAEQAWLAQLKNKSPDLRRLIRDRACEEAAALVGRRIPQRRPAPREQKKAPPAKTPAAPKSAPPTPEERKKAADARRHQKLMEIVGPENISIPEG